MEQFLSRAQQWLLIILNHKPPDVHLGQLEPPFQLSPIEKLPVELIVAIFHYCDPAVKALFTLTQICRRWRLIASESSSLWTNIRIAIGDRAGTAAFSNRLLLLDTQLSRTGNLLLDVSWFVNAQDYCHRDLIHLLRQKAPYSRWKSLKLDLRGVSRVSTEATLLDIDIFDHLESLTVHHTGFSPILNAINNTATCKLRNLEIYSSYLSNDTLQNYYAGMLRHSARLFLSVTWDATATAFQIPSNIKTLHTTHRTAHDFPHLTTYKLTECSFHEEYARNLRNLTELRVNGTIHVHDHCTVVLPSLQILVCAEIALNISAIIEAPLLEMLLFHERRHATTEAAQKNNWIHMLRSPGYLLSPRRVLAVQSSLSEEGIITLLAKCPNVERVALQFRDEISARKVVLRLMNIIGDVVSGLGPRQRLCPHMCELRLVFGWDIVAFKEWKARASLLIASRRDVEPGLVIYGRWKGQGGDLRLV